MEFCDEQKPWTHQEAVPRRIANSLMVSNPVLLLTLFLLLAAAHSIVTARKEEEFIIPSARGPGGKLLPLTKRKRTLSAKSAPTFTGLARRFFQTLTALVLVSFLVQAAAIVLHAVLERGDTRRKVIGWWPGIETIVYVAGSPFLYVYLLLTLVDWKGSPTIVHFLTFLVGFIEEAAILLALTVRNTGPHCTVEQHKYVVRRHLTTWDIADLSVAATRTVLIFGWVVVYGYIKLPYLITRRERATSVSPATVESTPLLSGATSPTFRGGYNTLADGSQQSRLSPPSESVHEAASTVDPLNTDTEAPPDTEDAFYRPKKLPHKSWYEYIRGYAMFFPYLWPRGNVGLQLLVLVCFCLMIVQRVVNVLVPLQTGALINAFSKSESMPWREMSLLLIFKFLQGTSGLLGAIRGLLWIPVSQNSYRSLTTASFEHVHSLSLDFHLGKRTGEVLSALNKGASINNFLEQVSFQVLPMLFDLLFAISYFYVYFDVFYAELVALVTFYYLYITTRMASTRSDHRRDMVNADREEEAVKNDSITSYETVKYFNAERYEFGRYEEAVQRYLNFESRYLRGMCMMSVYQTLVFMTGFLLIMFLGAWQVTTGEQELGTFVTLLTYLQQLQSPLNFFGSFYRTIQQSMISSERLLELFKVQPTVVDEPGVGTLDKCKGSICWSNVKFAYDRRKSALKNISFECKPGTTTAFVGESGGGKSTIFRLMYRYYNYSDGSIQLDGRDVRSLTIDSVRRHIGVVPQDTILFNETLMYNLRYANQNATDADIFAACKAARIHDRIIGFPDGYKTKVGERGLRLSGGEKQRVAIARTLLKNPTIIMLDEATSALDSSTEAQIQEEIQTIAKGRTLMIIAHRLSTIVHADQILVLQEGEIIEKGTHDELLELGGKYAAMWEKQSRAEAAEKAANIKQAEAKELLSAAGICTGNSSSAPEPQTKQVKSSYFKSKAAHNGHG